MYFILFMFFSISSFSNSLTVKLLFFTHYPSPKLKSLRQFPSSTVARHRGVGEICPGYLNSLDVVVLSCLWTGHLGWWFPFLRKGGSIGGSHSSASPEKSMSGYRRRESDRQQILVFRRNNTVYVWAVGHWTSFIPSLGCSRAHGSSPDQSTFASWTWRRYSTVST